MLIALVFDFNYKLLTQFEGDSPKDLSEQAFRYSVETEQDTMHVLVSRNPDSLFYFDNVKRHWGEPMKAAVMRALWEQREG